MKRYLYLLLSLLNLCVYAQNSFDLAEMKTKAEAGDVNAQTNLGSIYYSEQNYPEAVKWLRKAAEQGDAQAQYNLAVCYYEGKGVPKDNIEIVIWLRKAAEQGLKEAQLTLGSFYHKGYGVAKDYSEAAKWYKRAAEQESAEAKYNLGLTYVDNDLLPPDYLEALKWWRRAAEQENPQAQYNIGLFYYNGYGVAKDYHEAVNWYKKAAEQGFYLAQNNLGYCYECGIGIQKNLTEALDWYRKAAEQGYPEAQYNLGNCYKNGKGVLQDINEAIKWYRKAAEQGHTIAQYNLGVFYYDSQNHIEAVRWFRKAGEKGLSNAQYTLGICYENGIGVVENHSEALKYYTKAANQGEKEAIFKLATKFENGEDVPYNLDKAVELFCKAAELGKAESKNHLKRLYNSGIITLQDYPEISKWLDNINLQESGESYEYIGNKVWQEFRSHFPEPFRVVACHEKKDGRRIYIISEPPTNIRLHNIEEIFDGFIHYIWVKSKKFGYDGLMKDIIVYTDGIPSICHEQIVKDLNDLIYNTTYKASFMPLPYNGDTKQKHFDINCAITVNDRSLHNWVFGESKRFVNLLKNTELSSKEIFGNSLFGVFSSKTENIVMWTLPYNSDISKYKDLIHIFGIESDMILGAAISNNVVSIIGRKRASNTITFPPLRADEILMLAGSSNDIYQSLNVGTPAYLKIDGKYDWCPAWVSNDIIHSEFAHLLTITDVYLKFWLDKNKYELIGYNDYRPNNYFHNSEWEKRLNQRGGTIYNWNTNGYTFVTTFAEGTVLHFKNIGCLNLKLIDEENNRIFSNIEKEAYDYFINTHSSDIFRVAQYTMLYEIFKTFKITAKKESFYNSIIENKNDELPFFRNAQIILERVKNLSNFEIGNISKKIYNEELSSQFLNMTDKDIIDFVAAAGEDKIIREKWDKTLLENAIEKASEMNLTYEQFTKSEDYKVMINRIESEINNEILIKFQSFKENVEEGFCNNYIVTPIKKTRDRLNSLSPLQFQHLCSFCASPNEYKENDKEQIKDICKTLELYVISSYSKYFSINIKTMFDNYVKYYSNDGKTWFKTPSVVVINNNRSITKITPNEGIDYKYVVGGHNINIKKEEVTPSRTVKGQEILTLSGDPLKDAYYYAQKAVTVSDNNQSEMLKYIRQSKEALSQEIKTKSVLNKYNSLYEKIERSIYSEIRRKDVHPNNKKTLINDLSEVKNMAESELASDSNLSENKKEAYKFIQKVAEREEHILRDKKNEEVEDDEIKELKKRLKRLQMTLAELKKKQ